MYDISQKYLFIVYPVGIQLKPQFIVHTISIRSNTKREHCIAFAMCDGLYVMFNIRMYWKHVFIACISLCRLYITCFSQLFHLKSNPLCPHFTKDCFYPIGPICTRLSPMIYFFDRPDCRSESPPIVPIF